MEGMLTMMERADLEMKASSHDQLASESGVNDNRRTEQLPSLGDLPEHCIAAILSRLSPREVVRSACVCRSFWAAANFDSVWESILPRKYKDLLALDPDVVPTQFASKRQVFEHLSNMPLIYANKTQGFWLDRETGGVCLSIAARGITIIWSSTFEYWDWLHDPHSLFPEVARLKSVCWFEAKGEVEWSLPRGTYTFSWRLFLDNLSGWRRPPVTFKFFKNDVESTPRKCFIDPSPEFSRTEIRDFNLPTIRDVENGWREYDVAEFEVEEGEETCSLKFSMTECEQGNWKSGLCMDGVVVRPTNTIRETEQVMYPRAESGFHTPEFQPEGPEFPFSEGWFRGDAIRYVDDDDSHYAGDHGPHTD